MVHTSGGVERLVLAESLYKTVRTRVHENITGRHQNYTRNMQIMQKHFYRPKMKEQLKQMELDCLVCATEKSQGRLYQYYGEKQIPHASRETWHIDYAGLYNDSRAKYLLLITDALTLFTVLLAVQDRSAKILTEAFERHVVSIFGAKNVYADNELSLNSTQFQEYCAQNCITINHCNPYSAFSNQAQDG